jgi:hypothetical protein
MMSSAPDGLFLLLVLLPLLVVEGSAAGQRSRTGRRGEGGEGRFEQVAAVAATSLTEVIREGIWRPCDASAHVMCFGGQSEGIVDLRVAC